MVALLIVAAWVRFFGAGSFGLHKPDEDTTALPAIHILQDGTPRFPSGMFYARAIVQSYLIAGSVKVFGQSEWALRLPSVLTGILLVLLAYPVGRRFLEPAWNMAFVAVVALLPAFIADSQEVRMYAFLCASLAAYMALLFEWERTSRGGYLVAAVLAMLIAIQFQEIAVSSSLLLLFPGLARGDRSKLRQGLAALVVTAIGYKLISHWAGSFYPEVVADFNPSARASQTGEAPSDGGVRFSPEVLLPALVVSVGLVWLLVRTIATRAMAAIAGVLLYLGLVAQALLLYHLAAVVLAAGLIVARRHGGARASAVCLLAIACALIAAVHLWLLHLTMPGAGRQIIGVMVGEPSIWPYLQVAEYSPIAMLLVVGALTVGLWHVAHGGRVHDDVLFAMLGVFVPLFGIGFIGWYIPPRYGESELLPMLLCALAAAARLTAHLSGQRARGALPGTVAALIACLAILNPVAVAHSINAGKRFPDHRAAANYIRSLALGPHDIVMAEEALMQTYYLGHIDYWLTGARNASNFILPLDGRLVDEYTNTPVIDTGQALRELIDRPDRGAIYLIGSGEDQKDGRLYLRGEEISGILRSPIFKTVYVAPDGVTRVWKVDPPSIHSAAESG